MGTSRIKTTEKNLDNSISNENNSEQKNKKIKAKIVLLRISINQNFGKNHLILKKL